MHILKAHIRDSQLDANYLIIKDLSQYDSELPVKNNTWYVQAPGFVDPVEVIIPLNGEAAFSSVGLKLSDTVCILPDGIYTITYSVAPNSQLYTTAYHYRTAYLEQRLYGLLAALQTSQDPHTIDACGNVELTKLQKVYTTCLLYLEGLKANILMEKDLSHANAQYQEVQRLLDNVKSGY